MLWKGFIVGVLLVLLGWLGLRWLDSGESEPEVADSGASEDEVVHDSVGEAGEFLVYEPFDSDVGDRDSHFKQQFERLRNSRNIYARYRLFEEWAKVDPEAALYHCEMLAKEGYYNTNLVHVIKGWATHDPDAAWDWLARNGGGDRSCYNAILKELSDHGRWKEGLLKVLDREESANVLSYDPKQSFKSELSQIAMKLWAENDLDGATAFLEELPDEIDPLVRADMLSGFAEGWIVQDSTSATNWVLALEEGPERKRVIHRMLDTWSFADPGAAGKWALSLEDNRDYSIGVMLAAARYTHIDPQEAFSWAENAEDWRHRRWVYNWGLENLMRRDPVVASEWMEYCISRINTKADGGRVDYEYQVNVNEHARMVARWMEKDLEAATAYLYEGSGMPQERIEILERRVFDVLEVDNLIRAVNDYLALWQEADHRGVEKFVQMTPIDELFAPHPNMKAHFETIAIEWAKVNPDLARFFVSNQKALTEAETQALLDKIDSELGND